MHRIKTTEEGAQNGRAVWRAGQRQLTSLHTRTLTRARSPLQAAVWMSVPARLRACCARSVSSLIRSPLPPPLLVWPSSLSAWPAEAPRLLSSSLSPPSSSPFGFAFHRRTHHSVHFSRSNTPSLSGSSWCVFDRFLSPEQLNEGKLPPGAGDKVRR